VCKREGHSRRESRLTTGREGCPSSRGRGLAPWAARIRSRRSRPPALLVGRLGLPAPRTPPSTPPRSIKPPAGASPRSLSFVRVRLATRPSPRTQSYRVCRRRTPGGRKAGERRCVMCQRPLRRPRPYTAMCLRPRPLTRRAQLTAAVAGRRPPGTRSMGGGLLAPRARPPSRRGAAGRGCRRAGATAPAQGPRAARSAPRLAPPTRPAPRTSPPGMGCTSRAGQPRRPARLRVGQARFFLGSGLRMGSGLWRRQAPISPGPRSTPCCWGRPARRGWLRPAAAARLHGPHAGGVTRGLWGPGAPVDGGWGAPRVIAATAARHGLP
jgi:hypothetical protein